MPTYIPVNESYSNQSDLVNVINYVFNPCKVLSNSYGGLQVRLESIESIIKDFLFVKNIYGKTDGRQLRHFIISFDPEDNISPQEALKMAYIASEYYSDYQMVFTVHENKPNLHIHFVMNSVSYKTGKKYAGGECDWYSFVNYCKKRIPNF